MLTDDGLARFNPKNVCVGHQFILATLFPNTVYAATLVIAGPWARLPRGFWEDERRHVRGYWGWSIVGWSGRMRFREADLPAPRRRPRKAAFSCHRPGPQGTCGLS